MRTVLRIGMIACLFMVAATIPAFGKGTPNIQATIHNLSTTAPIDPFFPQAFYQSNEDEICVFCHTPHGGSLTGPLWNRTNPATSWTHYTSATLSSQVGASTRSVNAESLLCLSCHDGSISVYHIINPSNDGPATIMNANNGQSDVKVASMFGTNLGALVAPGGDLSDDHPISFSYQSVINNYPYSIGNPKYGQLRPIGDESDNASALGWKGEGVRFFGTTYRLECSSCHDPHVDYIADARYTPFLIRPNTGSDLCLSCHVK